MEVSQYGLAWMLLSSFLCGLVLGACYDLLRLTRMWIGAELPPRARHLRDRLALPQKLKWSAGKAKAQKSKRLTDTAKAILLFVEDVVFCLLVAITVVLLLYRANDGQFRLSAVVVLFGGLAAYLMTLGRLIQHCATIIVVVLRAALIWSGAILAYPFARLIRLLIRWTAPLRVGIGRQFARLKQRIQSRKQARMTRRTYQNQSEVSTPRPTNGKHYFSMGGQMGGKA